MLVSILGIKSSLLLNDSGQFLLCCFELSFSQSKFSFFHVEEQKLGLHDLRRFVVITHGAAPLANTLESGGGALGDVATEDFTLGVVAESEFEVGSEEFDGFLVDQVLLFSTEESQLVTKRSLQERGGELFI